MTKGGSRHKNWCMARVLSFLIKYFSNYCTLHGSDLAARAAPLDPRLMSKYLTQSFRKHNQSLLRLRDELNLDIQCWIQSTREGILSFVYVLLETSARQFSLAFLMLFFLEVQSAWQEDSLYKSLVLPGWGTHNLPHPKQALNTMIIFRCSYINRVEPL